MGLTAGKFNLNSGQLGQFLGGTTDPTERTAPLSRYGTHHPVDKALWLKDRAAEVGKKFTTAKKAKPQEVLNTVSAAQGRGR